MKQARVGILYRVPGDAGENASPSTPSQSLGKFLKTGGGFTFEKMLNFLVFLGLLYKAIFFVTRLKIFDPSPIHIVFSILNFLPHTGLIVLNIGHQGPFRTLSDLRVPDT